MKNFKLRINLFLSFLILIISSDSNAFNRLKNIDYLVENNMAKVTLLFKSDIKLRPKLTLKDKIIQLEIQNATVWPKIEKMINIGWNNSGTLMAYQFNKDMVRFRSLLPFKVVSLGSVINYKVDANKIIVKFPLTKPITAAGIIKNKEIKKEAVKYDESFLEKLLSENKKSELENKKDILNAKNDSISMRSASPLKSQTKNIPFNKDNTESNPNVMSKYLGKFFLFFGLVILLFFVLVTIFKKGVVKRGKLGFLKGNDLVQIVSTTYVGPKKNLLLVKVQDQLMLLGSSENTINLISHLDRPMDALKAVEGDVYGSNFDDKLKMGEEKNKNFKLKESLLQENIVNNDLVANVTIKKEKKLKNQIKDKLKSLKPLQ